VNYFQELQKTLGQIDPSPLLDFVRDCQGTLWLAGNGGSASTAQHWACDLSKAAGRRVQALGSNPAVLTAWANDVSYSEALAKEFEHSARLGDALIVLSCSGRSSNILALIGAALGYRIPHMLITGAHAPTYAQTPAMVIPHTHYGVLEDCHLAIGHWLTEELRG